MHREIGICKTNVRLTLIPCMHGATLLLGPDLPQLASILLYPQLISSILVFLGPVMLPSERPLILFLIFLPNLCCKIPH
jgi:hypothetical protein